MGKKSGKERISNQINAGSMADIAFLLLIFFLVTTTMDQDKGLLVLLPPWNPDFVPEDIQIRKRNLLTVSINANDELLVRGEVLDINLLRAKTKEFIANPNNDENMAVAPNRAIVSLRNDRGTHYNKYIAVYNELKAAYTELRDEEAKRRYGSPLDKLSEARRREIIDLIPLILSEAEETAFGEER